MRISEITRRDILDELRLRNLNWNGRLDEIDFLNRLYSTEQLPSNDGRFPNMARDIWQHRVNNHDLEDDWWVFADDRLELGKDDKKYLDFLCEMLHPVVRSDETEVAALLELFNRRLIPDGWKLTEKEKISGHPVFVAIANDAQVEVHNPDRISSEYALSQLKKCEEKISSGDYDGAISAARSLVESVFADIFNKTTGETIEKGGSLMDSYKLVKGLLNLSDDRYANEAIKNILRSISSIVEGVDSMSNIMGDRHIRPAKPERHHAQLCVNSAKTLVSFLYDTLEYRFKGKENIYDQLISALDTETRLLSREEMMKDKEVQRVYARTDPNIRNMLKKQIVTEYVVNSYRRSDVFFAALRILRDELKPADLRAVYETHEENDQACGLRPFLLEIEAFNPDLITTEMKEFSHLQPR
jgi:hypothetical protein